MARLLLLLLLLLALPLAAQPDPWEEALQGLEELEIDLRPSGFGDDPRALAAYAALEERKYVRAREITEEILRQDPGSIPGHCLLGLVHHYAEGSLPVALFHLERCRELFEERHGRYPGDDAPWFWHALSITEIAYVNGEMGRHQEKVRHLLERDELYEPPRPAELGWPLMRMRRYDEARAAVEAALATGEVDQVITAKTALCAIEAEEQNREASYRACLEAAEYDRQLGQGNPTPFTNAAEAALGVLRMGEAEQLIQEAAEHFAIGVSNPWLDATLLYLAQGRTAEALEAVRRMFRWRSRQPAFMDEQNRAETEMVSAVFLVVAGHPAEAASITERALARPDRTGFTSSESEQMEAATALVDRLAHRTAAELELERASWSPFAEAARARLRAARWSLRAWSSGRRVAALLAEERILFATLRPYLAGSVEIPEWIKPELVAPVGPGVVAAAVGMARERETLDDAGGYFAAYETEIASLEGDEKATLRLAREALDTLPAGEVLLQSRVAALGAAAALDGGDLQTAVELFDRAMQHDPGVIRRLGLSLPTAFETAPTPIARRAAEHLHGSPRFDEARAGFRIRLEGIEDAGEALLLGVQGTVLARVRVVRRAGETTDDVARRLAAELHAEAFAPRLDLTQADLRSLDGSPTAGGGRASERLHNILSEMTGEEEPP